MSGGQDPVSAAIDRGAVTAAIVEDAREQLASAMRRIVRVAGVDGLDACILSTQIVVVEHFRKGGRA